MLKTIQFIYSKRALIKVLFQVNLSLLPELTLSTLVTLCTFQPAALSAPTPEQRPLQPLWSGERDAPRIPVSPSACRPAIVATGTSQTSFPPITSSHINTLFKLVKDNARSFVVCLRHAYCLLLLPMDVYKHRLIKSYLKPKNDCQ